MEILVQNKLFWNIVGERPTAHLATAGEITLQEWWLYDELALLAFYRSPHCTKLPRTLLFMFLFGTME